MENPGPKAGGFSFGFSKTKEQKVLKDGALKNEDKESDKATDYVISLEGKLVNSTLKEAVSSGPLVIPLIQTNRWKPLKPEDFDSEDNISKPDTKLKVSVETTGDAVTDQAVQEILKSSAEDPDGESQSLAIPLLMKNKAPGGFENDEKLDVSLRPDEAEPADYEAVPIEQYGLALLRGMGWKDGEGIGKNNKSVKPVDAVLRPKGLGLGADRSKAAQAKDGTKTDSNSKEEKLDWKKGAYCMVETGKQQGLYGQVEGMDTDNARVFIKLTLGGESVTMSQYAVKLVTRKDYDKNSTYINKSKADKYKEEQSKKLKPASDTESRSDSERRHSKKKHKRDRSREREDRQGDSHRHRGTKNSDSPHDSHTNRDSRDRDSQRDSHRDSDSHSRNSDSQLDSHRDKNGEDRREKRRKHDDEQSDRHRKAQKRHHSKPSNESTEDMSLSWLQPHLRVRLVDKNFKKGKYYKSKVIIEDVISFDKCICRTEDGKVLEDLRQSQLETVIPRSEPSFIMILSGRRKGQIGEVLQKDKARCVANVQLLSDRDVVLSLDYNSICEYTGDVDDFEF